MKPQIEHVPTERLIPYARNSRTHSEAQVAQIAASIREFGFTNPVLIGEENDIIAGHGRILAARKLGLEEVPCIRLGHLSETQKRAYVIADNKLALNAGWDEELLRVELKGLEEDGFDIGLVGFTAEEIAALLNAEESNNEGGDYTQKITAPVYEPKGDNPPIAELIDAAKAEDLLSKVESSNCAPEIKAFLKKASSRHLVFDYGKIAEFYCHADKETQSLMEDLALVVVDFKKALQLGYAKFKDEISDAMECQSDEGKSLDDD
jgi:hypothetical protein